MSSAFHPRPRRLWIHAVAALALWAGAALPAAAAGSDKKSGAAPTLASKAYDYYLTGNAVDMTPPAPAAPMVVLMGGGLEVDGAFARMIARARSGQPDGSIDAVVLRASGEDGYNAYLAAMAGIDSVETLVVKTRAGANDPKVRDIVANADLLFIAGGDQWDYVNLWKGTLLSDALKGLIEKRVPIGGTSAGLAVLGEFDFSAQNGTITSTDAMSNPYDRRLTLDSGFLLGSPALKNTIADSHLVARDRMGRLVTFLARMVQDGLVAGPQAARGIGVDEETAVVIDGSQATVMGNSTSRAAYFLRPTMAPTTLVPKKPETYSNIQVQKVSDGKSFDLATWTSGGGSYNLDVISGVLTSSSDGGSPY